MKLIIHCHPRTSTLVSFDVGFTWYYTTVSLLTNNQIRSGFMQVLTVLLSYGNCTNTIIFYQCVSIFSISTYTVVVTEFVGRSTARISIEQANWGIRHVVVEYWRHLVSAKQSWISNVLFCMDMVCLELVSW